MRTAIASTVLLMVLSAVGCRYHGEPIILRDDQRMQWYWPYFLDGKPTILAFWSTEDIESLRAIDGLNTLARMHGPIQVISIATGPDSEEIDAWIRGRRGTPVQFTVLVDQHERLAKKLKVTGYPTFIYYDRDGDEIDRSYSVKNIRKWYYERWLKRAGALRRVSATRS